MRALNNIFEFTGITDHDWRALECTRMNGMATKAQFKRTCPGDPEYGSWEKSRKPGVIIGNTSRRANELEEGQQGTAGAATNIVHTFISSHAHLLILESTPTSSSRRLGRTTYPHSRQPQATAGKRSRCLPNRSGSSQPRGKRL